jgi:hypothetical protein
VIRVRPRSRGDHAGRIKCGATVDNAQYETTSVLATIERRFDLAPLSSRDAAVNDLSNVFQAKQFARDESARPAAGARHVFKTASALIRGCSSQLTQLLS